MSGPEISGPDLSRIDTWLFDLDDTLYPAETELMDLIRDRITQFVMQITGEDWEGARAIQRGWFEEHGAALPGLLAAHEVSAKDFLDFVHDVPLDRIQPDPALDAALDRLPGRRLVFTNGSADHAGRILDRLGIALAVRGHLPHRKRQPDPQAGAGDLRSDDGPASGATAFDSVFRGTASATSSTPRTWA